MRKLLLSAITAFALTASTAFAQSGTTVTGRVTSDAGVPLGGATVFLAGTNIGAQTSDDGNYSFVVPASRATGGTTTLTARVIGYTARSVQVTLTPGSTVNQSFALPINPFHLGEVVVTGAGTSTTRERLGVTINRVDSSAIRKASEPQNIIAALAAKAPNVNVRTQSGEPGAGASVVIRGEASLTGTNQPLFVVDGQPIDNQTVSTAFLSVNGGSLADRQGGTVTPNRAADINPADIENIEILKGSAAAAIYGARAANGVILITTKRGHTGATRVNVSSSVNFDKARLVDFLQHDYAQGSLARRVPIPDAAATCGSTPDCAPTAGRTSWGAKLPAGTPTYDHMGELFQTGYTADNNVQISGGSDRTNFFSSVGLTNQVGIIKGPNSKYNRASFRLKGTQEVGSKITLGGNFSYVDARGAFVQHGNDVSGLLIGALRTPPAFNNQPYLTDRGLQRVYRFPNPTSVEAFNCCAYYDNPFFAMASNGNRSEVGRAISNFNVDWRPLAWLSVKETLGGDYYNDSRLQALPLTSANDPAGSVIRADQTNLVIDHNLIASATGNRGENLNATFTVGQNLNSRRYRQLSSQGEGLIGPVPLAIENTINQTGLEFKSLRHIESYFGQGELNLYNQFYLTAGLRNDGFSTFGASQRRHTFKKASAAWTFTNLLKGEDQTGLLSFGKLRAAFGETGREPDVYAALNALSTIVQFGSGYGDALRTSIGGVPGVTSSLRLGNPALRPELQRETEIGADLGFFNQKIDLSVVGYNKKSTDVILPITVNSAATGFTSAFKNTGSLTNRGLEISLNARPYTGQNLAWELGAQYGRNRGKVTSLGGAQIFDLLEGFGANEAEGADVIGYAPGVIIGTGTIMTAKVIGSDRATDLALLDIANGTLSYPSLGTTGDLRLGQAVVGVGAGKGNRGWVDIGVVNDRSVVIPGDGTTIAGLVATSIRTTPENTGGALLDPNGKVVGILTLPPSAPAGLAVPINMARDVVSQLESTGKVAHGWLGVTFGDDANDRASGGATIAAVSPGGPASKDGLLPGDVVVQANSRSIAGMNELMAAIRRLHPGDPLELSVMRANRPRPVTVTVGADDGSIPRAAGTG